MLAWKSVHWLERPLLALLLLAALPVSGQLAKLVEKLPGAAAEVNCSPRPFPGAKDVPLSTSIYFEISPPATPQLAALEAGLEITLTPEQGSPVKLLTPGEAKGMRASFTAPASGWLRPGEKSLLVYVETGRKLLAATRYTVNVSSRDVATGATGEIAHWWFTTGTDAATATVRYQLDLDARPVQWHGKFFDGVCNVVFCTHATNYGGTWKMMADAHAQHPSAWNLQRDFWLTGSEFRKPEGIFPSNLPNLVRERETRRIVELKPEADGLRLRLEDFYGHEQYGIPSGRPVDEDYHVGDEVLIADGYHSARSTVLKVDREQVTVTIARIESPTGGWKLDYTRTLRKHQDPDAPGLFPPGGCYLRKYVPAGTACFFWRRLDKEWDLAVRGGRRVIVNFADAPGDLSRDGQSWTTVKDYAQWHQVARAITSHIIERYGTNSLTFTWSIFNEPDLLGVFWRSDWDELQRYYDYTTDAILRAFEDHGYDSSRVFIGGLEMGAIFGTNFVKLREFLAHCSPTVTMTGALMRNAAVADSRLDGRRSQRVENLCRAHDGKGAPCDFVSVHLYNQAEMCAAKLSRVKEIALEIDPSFYRDLWVNSHEACPDWLPPEDEAARDEYQGDGYFESWCADIIHRQLSRAAADRRFAFGETLLTVWPPPDIFFGLNAVTGLVQTHNARGGLISPATFPTPVFQLLTLISDMGPNYWVLPEQQSEACVMGGFASQDARGVTRILVFTHASADTQSRSERKADFEINISGLKQTEPARVQTWRFDRDHNSPLPELHHLLEVRPPRERASDPVILDERETAQLRRSCDYRPSSESSLPVEQGKLKVHINLPVNACELLILSRGAGEKHR